MPKVKTHKGAAKRFKITRKGKVLRARAFKSHILEKKTSKRKRKYRKKAQVDSAGKKTIKRLLAS